MDDQNTAWTSIDLYYKGVHVKKSLPQNVKIEELIKTVDTYLEAGFEPSWNKDTNKAQTAVQQPLATPQAPLCGVHGTPMNWKSGVSQKTGKPYAFWTCSQKNADGSYCNYKPDK